MRFANFVLGAVLLGLTACGHSRPLPTLPASHGQLSWDMDQYLNPRPYSPPVYMGVLAPRRDTGPSVSVTAEEAPAIFAEATRVLAGKPTEEQVRQAQADLGAACSQADLLQACDFLREEFGPPVGYSRVVHEFPHEVYRQKTLAMVVVGFIVGTNGRLRDIRLVESATDALDQAVLKTVASMRFHPATLAGHPIEIHYTVKRDTVTSEMDLTPEQELAWGMTRVKAFPDSIEAWGHLARAMARDRAEDPGYEEALRGLNQLSPEYWWSATELAWLYARAGRHEEAAPLAIIGRRRARDNAYALETSALVAFHQGRCQQAVQEQREAVMKLPAEWPREERERFQRTLTTYQEKCATGPAPASPQAASTLDAATPEDP
ncbi:TonB family protein [Myxococcus faecalis]|uniref:TonB family protein n=1 Tax=Myxococcus faecalis TaxID=3115646 RepID=UPI003CE9244E